MSEEKEQVAHHNFSSQAHNQAMDILFEDGPTQEKIGSLIELAHVAHWHWMNRTDRTVQNESVALWLLSRAYSANGYGEAALRYAQKSLAKLDGSGLLPSFFGYSHEALSRAYTLLDEVDLAKDHLKMANEIAATVPNEQAKKWLLEQINQIQIP